MSKITAAEVERMQAEDLVIEDLEYERQVVLKKRKEAGTVTCPSCRRGIRKNQRMIVGRDKLRYHEFCAVDEQQIAVCQDCFMVSCECENPAAIVVSPVVADTTGGAR